jgi:hypothetical protein
MPVDDVSSMGVLVPKTVFDYDVLKYLSRGCALRDNVNRK